MQTEVHVKLPLPLDVASTLMNAFGTLYPGTTIKNDTFNEMVFSIPEDERKNPKVGDLEKEYAPSDADLEATLSSVRDGTLGVSTPEWFTKVLLGGVLQILVENPDAKNYLEQQLRGPNDELFVVTIARSPEQTPHVLRMAAEKRAEKYAVKLRSMGVDPDED